MSKTVEKQGKMQGGITGKGFVKGKSGNPKGRPKKDRCIPDILRELTAESVAGNKTKLYTMLSSVVDNAMNGDQWSIQFVAERMEGKPAQVVTQRIEELPKGFQTTIV
ncbi:MAG: hypothetical protein HOK80_02880 [Candidatus Cloacimonetes bacterium]|nr:hypothetical protein [Candidatus Cloacimonadota bacterium]